MSMDRPAYFDWIREDLLNYEEEEDDEEESGDEELWEYFKFFNEYPRGDAPEQEIVRFILDAKQAERAAEQDFIEEGCNPEKARFMACQWPLREDAPMEIVRDYIRYSYELQEAAKNGVDL